MPFQNKSDTRRSAKLKLALLLAQELVALSGAASLTAEVLRSSA
jgi:hypothetical protein